MTKMAHWGAGGTGKANEETEWDSILKKHGIKKDTGNSKKTEEWVDEEEKQREAKEKRLNNATMDELDELEDDEDEDFLEKYRQARLKEMQASAMVNQKMVSGIPEISKNQWKDEVTESSKKGKVCVLLYKPGDDWSALLERNLIRVASKFPSVKFVKIVYSTAVSNFPEKSVPALLIYDGDKPIKQIIGVAVYSASKMTPEIVEWVLHCHDVVESKMEEDPRKSEAGMTRGTNLNYIGIENFDK